MKLTNNPKQGLYRIYHCVKQKNPSWFDSGMQIQKPILMKGNRLYPIQI